METLGRVCRDPNRTQKIYDLLVQLPTDTEIKLWGCMGTTVPQEC